MRSYGKKLAFIRTKALLLDATMSCLTSPWKEALIGIITHIKYPAPATATALEPNRETKCD